MERVTFLEQDSGQRISCLLNPESVVQRRAAGVSTSRSGGGLATGTELRDDPILFTGGGRTELELDLLFDCSLAGRKMRTSDVRELTYPIWLLAENNVQPNQYGKPPSIRFIWGKSWNIPGVVVAVAERLENFNSNGEPQRSWLRMRMCRISTQQQRGDNFQFKPHALDGLPTPQPGTPVMPLSDIAILSELHETTGREMAPGAQDDTTENAPLAQERLDQIANRCYGSPHLWRFIAGFNDIIDPLRLRVGQLLALPHLDSLLRNNEDVPQ